MALNDSGSVGSHGSCLDTCFDDLSREQVEWSRMALQLMENQITRLLEGQNLVLEFQELDAVTECTEFYDKAGGCSEGLLAENAKKNRYCNVIPFDRTRVKLGARNRPAAPRSRSDGQPMKGDTGLAMENKLDRVNNGPDNKCNTQFIESSLDTGMASEVALAVEMLTSAFNMEASSNRLLLHSAVPTTLKNAGVKEASCEKPALAMDASTAANDGLTPKDAQAVKKSLSAAEARGNGSCSVVQATTNLGGLVDPCGDKDLPPAMNDTLRLNDHAMALKAAHATDGLSLPPGPAPSMDHALQEQEAAALRKYGKEPVISASSVGEARQPKRDSFRMEHQLLAMVWNRSSDYINASYVRDEKCPRLPVYIATQGPIRSTEVDFWQMVVENDCKAIVMLTKEFEEGRKKCRRYFPDDESEELVYPASNLTISTKVKKLMGPIVCRELEVVQFAPAGTSIVLRTVHHYQILNWPDHGTPLVSTPLRALIRQFRVLPLLGDSPLVVHCSAGIGRTGVYIVLDYTLRRILNGDIGAVNIMDTVQRLRAQRPGIVQTKEQYLFCFKAIREELMELVMRTTANNAAMKVP